MAWTNRTKIINQLINRSDGIVNVMLCPTVIGIKNEEWCLKHSDCGICINKWLDEKIDWHTKGETDD